MVKKLYILISILQSVAFFSLLYHTCSISVEGWGALGLAPFAALLIAIGSFSLVLGCVGCVGVIVYFGTKQTKKRIFRLIIATILSSSPAIVIYGTSLVQRYVPHFNLCFKQ